MSTVAQESSVSKPPTVSFFDRNGERGWHVDYSTLEPVIHDLAKFREEFEGDPARDAIEALWEGRYNEAIELFDDLVKQAPHNVLYRAFLADAHRFSGKKECAIIEYRTLLDDTRGTPEESVIMQHFGKALFGYGYYAEALSAFSRAYEQYSITGGPAELVDACMVALTRTHQKIREQGKG